MEYFHQNFSLSLENKLRSALNINGRDHSMYDIVSADFIDNNTCFSVGILVGLYLSKHSIDDTQKIHDIAFMLSKLEPLKFDENAKKLIESLEF